MLMLDTAHGQCFSQDASNDVNDPGGQMGDGREEEKLFWHRAPFARWSNTCSLQLIRFNRRPLTTAGEGRGGGV
jgi:hypothetical protein